MSKVFVAWLHPGEVNAAFAESLSGMLAWDFFREVEHGQERQISGMRGFHAGVNIAGPRNGVVREFLARPEWNDYLLSIDVDMQFPPNAVELLLESADPEKAPIVGGLCFGATDDKVWPTMYELLEDEDGPYFARLNGFEPHSLVRVSGTGGAFLMVHRSVLEAVEAKEFSKGYPWYQETEFPNGPVGEDLTFCLRAGICGFPVHVDTRLVIGHVKATLLTARKWFEQKGPRPIIPPLPPAEPGYKGMRVHTFRGPDLTEQIQEAIGG